MKYNPGSTALVRVMTGLERPVFQKFFMCLKPVLDGFLAGCRPIIGLDGCHLTGAHPGICLTAVGKDGNNNVYPLAWAVVDVEEYQSWAWFLTHLKDVLGSNTGNGFTFMSDRQKGLIKALEDIVPDASSRYCWRHLWSNFKQKWNGEAYKFVLWAAAKATTQVLFC